MSHTHIEHRPCFLHTLAGTRPAETGAVIPAEHNRHGRPLLPVRATDTNESITVYVSLAYGKFNSEPVPTFYAC